jgi:hypothetical protein
MTRLDGDRIAPIVNLANRRTSKTFAVQRRLIELSLPRQIDRNVLPLRIALEHSFK